MTFPAALAILQAGNSAHWSLFTKFIDGRMPKWWPFVSKRRVIGLFVLTMGVATSDVLQALADRDAKDTVEKVH